MGGERLTTELAESLLKGGCSIRLRATGWSMKPLLTSGCLLHVAPIQQAPKIGEIVLYRSQGDRLVSHRVVAKSSGVIWTKGDSCSQVDKVLDLQQILGKVVAVEEPIYFPLSGRLARQAGLFLSRFYPVLVKLKKSVRQILEMDPVEGKA
jgi:hypothetical protein